MINKPNTNEQTAPTVEDFKDHSYGLSKFDHELFKEEDDTIQTVIRVKHINLPNKGDRWRVMENSDVVFVLEGAKLSKKERIFLRTVEGTNFLLCQAKAGIKSFNQLRIEMKKVIKPLQKKVKTPKK